MICKYFLIVYLENGTSYFYSFGHKNIDLGSEIEICTFFVFLMWQWYHKNFGWQEELCWLFFLTTVNKSNI